MDPSSNSKIKVKIIKQSTIPQFYEQIHQLLPASHVLNTSTNVQSFQVSQQAIQRKIANQIFQLDLSQWQYLSQGSYRIVFHHKIHSYLMQSATPLKINGLNKYVLLLNKKQYQTAVDKQINQHYLEELSRSKLNKYLFSTIKLKMVQLEHDLIKIQNKIKASIKKGQYQISKGSNKNVEFILAENIFANDTASPYDLILELKTKTILPDLYLKSTLTKISAQRSIPVQEIQDAILNAHPMQKSKWFKSRIAFNKREKESSFDFYGLGKEIEKSGGYCQFDCLNQKNIKYGSQKFKHMVSNSVFVRNMNEVIIQQLKKQQILVKISQILQLVNQPKELNNYPATYDYGKLPYKLPYILQQIHENINKKQNFTYQYANLEKQQCIHNSLQQSELSQQSRWINLYKYLIFICISDLSIIMKLKIKSQLLFELSNGLSQRLEKQLSKYIECEFKIVDFQLIPLKHVNSRYVKYESVLNRYLDYKGVGSKFSYKCNHNENEGIYGQNKKQLARITQNLRQDFGQMERSQPIAYLKLQLNGYNKNIYQKIVLANFQNLCFLDLSVNHIGVEGITLLSSQTKKFPMLYYLNMDRNNLGREGARYLAKISMNKLKILKINYNCIEDEGLRYISQAGWTALVHIQLKADWNKITDKGMHYINEKTWQNLDRISLMMNKIEERGIKMIQVQWQQLTNKIRYLNLWETQLKNEGVKILSGIKFISLNKIVLGGNHINDEGLMSLGNAQWPNLRALDLCLNLIQLNFEAKSQKWNIFSELTQLRLGTNNIKGRNIQNLVLINIPKIIFLDLYANSIGDEGMQILNTKQWPNLKSLDISLCQISDKSMAKIDMERYPELSELLMLRNSISAAGVKKLLEGKNNCLSTVDIRANKVSKQQIKTLLDEYEIETKINVMIV